MAFRGKHNKPDDAWMAFRGKHYKPDDAWMAYRGKHYKPDDAWIEFRGKLTGRLRQGSVTQVFLDLHLCAQYFLNMLGIFMELADIFNDFSCSDKQNV